MSIPTLAQLKQALVIAERIHALEGELASVVGGSSIASIIISPSTPVGKKGRRKMSAATIAKMRASQQARWAKLKGSSPAAAKAPAPAKKKTRAINPEARAKMAAAAKKRWAAIKAGKAANPFGSRGAKKK